MTKKKLSLIAGISPNWLSSIVSGVKIPSLKTANTLGRITGTDPTIWTNQDKPAMSDAIDRLQRACALAELSGIEPDRLGQIIRGDIPLSVDDAMCMADGSGLTPQDWLGKPLTASLKHAEEVIAQSPTRNAAICKGYFTPLANPS